MTAGPSRPAIGVTADEVRDCLEHILNSPQFSASDRLKRFLTFAVDQSLESADGPKEYEIGVRVYDRGEEFDPTRDSIVRTEAARLRKRLDEYYEGEGGRDAVRIDIPRGGYRATFSKTPTSQHVDGSSGPKPAVTRRPIWWVTAAVLTVLVLAAIWSTGLATVSSGERFDESTPYVLIGEFVNRTGNPAVDDAVESGVEVHLSSRPGLQPLPQVRIDDALRLMARPVDSAVSPRLAREVALRDGAVRAVLDGTVRRVDAGYELTARLRDPRTDRLIGTLVAEASDRQLLSASRAVADWAQTQLGGSRQPPGDLERVTTDSLRAVQLYSEANKYALRGRWAHAETLLEQALIEDPRFASAHLLLAWARRNQGPPENWRAPLAEAVAHSSRATEIERLFIAGSSHTLEGRTAEARTAYETLLRMSPDHFWANNNLAATLSRLDATNAAVHIRRTADLRPNDARVQVGSAWEILIGTDAVNEATALLARARTLRPPEDAYLLPAAEAFEAWARGDIDTAVRRMKAIAERDADDQPVRYALFVGMPLAGLGMHHRARVAISGRNTSDRWDGWMALAAGDRVHTRQAADKLVYPNALNAILQTRVGRRDAAEALIRRDKETYAVGYDPAFHDAVWDVARAEVLIARKQIAAAEPLFASAMTRLEPVHGTHIEYFLAADQLAAIFAASGRRTEARATLERAVARRGRVFAMALTFWTLCARHLERLYREDGRVREAQVLRNDLERILVAADPTVRAALLPTENNR